MSIGELSRRSGLAASCIRYYERIGLLPRAARVSGRRMFDADALRRLALVTAAAQTGFSLAEIRELVSESKSGKWRIAVLRKIDELDATVRRFRTMKRMLEEALRCGCVDAELCLRFYELLAPRAFR
jgi:DNA-binding transcriptional MerR regulator